MAATVDRHRAATHRGVSFIADSSARSTETMANEIAVFTSAETCRRSSASDSKMHGEVGAEVQSEMLVNRSGYTKKKATAPRLRPPAAPRVNSS
jgi:hypothetical protein